MSENTKHLNKTFHISIETTFYETYQTNIIEKGSKKNHFYIIRLLELNYRKLCFYSAVEMKTSLNVFLCKGGGV